MKIAVTSTGQTLDDVVDPRFGRCSYFVVVETESGKAEAVSNPGRDAAGGAGPQATQAVSDAGAETIITGNLGPNAAQALGALGIPVYQCESGTVAEAIERYKKGVLTAISGPTVGSHHGMKA